MTLRSALLAALLAASFTSPALRADPLHALANDAYWHHESNFIFPAKLGEFSRAGAPQELDGTSTVVAYYALGAGDARRVVVVEVFPITEDSKDEAATDERGIVKTVDHGGWRVIVRAPKSGAAETQLIEALVRALAIDRLGATDTRCPNAGCGT